MITSRLRNLNTIAPSFGPGCRLTNVRIRIAADGHSVPDIVRSYVLPAGRTSTGPSGERIYAAKLDPLRVAFGGGTFELIPTLTVTRDALGRQTVTLNPDYNGREGGMFRAHQTRFNLSLDWLDGGQRFEFNHMSVVSCLEPATPIRLHDGQQVAIGEVVAGEYVRNPLSRAAMRIAKVIRGPEPFPLISIRSEKGEVRFSQAHPVLTAQGCKQAAAVDRGDELVCDGGACPVLDVRPVPPRLGQLVYNLEFDEVPADPKDHLFLANGIVVGDYWLQDRLAEKHHGAGALSFAG